MTQAAATLPARSITVGREVCQDFAQSSHLEWLETNGTGAFAMSTVAGCNTRRYHALLVATLKPPVERYVLLSRVEDEAMLDGHVYALGVTQYPGTVARAATNSSKNSGRSRARPGATVWLEPRWKNRSTWFPASRPSCCAIERAAR